MNRLLNVIAAILFLSAVLWATSCSHQQQQAPLAGSTAVAEPQATESTLPPSGNAPEPAVAGDLVTVHYTMKLENGDVFYTTDRKIAEDKRINKADWFRAPAKFGPEEIKAGDEPTRRELALEVVGMAPGGKKSVTMPPEKGFGEPDPKKMVQLERGVVIPRYAGVTAADYMARMKTLPVKDTLINWTPYFKSKIVNVTEKHVEMAALVEGPSTHPAPYGTTTVTLEGDEVHISLEPAIGAPFEVNGQKGRITASDDKTFTVDLNHPAAGQPIILDIAVLGITKVSVDKAEFQPHWILDHDKGYASAAAEHKPMVMVLYADWCGWCKKLINTTIPDPRVQKYWDTFVWTKVNSDKLAEYKERYQQKGFPLVIMTNAEGKVVNRIDGFRDPLGLIQELEKVLAGTAPSGGQG